MPLTVGGGVRTLDDIRKLLLAGADKVAINTAAVRNPEFVREAALKFGSQCIVVAIDAKRAGPDGQGEGPRFRGVHPRRAQGNRHRRRQLGETHGGVRGG